MFIATGFSLKISRPFFLKFPLCFALRSARGKIRFSTFPRCFEVRKKFADDSRKIQREGCAPRPRFLCPMPQSHLIYRNWHVAPRTVSRAIVIRNKELLPRDPFRSHPLSDESSSENFDRGFVRSTGKERANIERCFRLNSELNVREAFCCGHTRLLSRMWFLEHRPKIF